MRNRGLVGALAMAMLATEGNPGRSRPRARREPRNWIKGRLNPPGTQERERRRRQIKRGILKPTR